MQEKYALFVVLNKVKKTKAIVKRLKEIGITSFTLVNSFGSYNLCTQNVNYSPFIGGTLKSSESYAERSYNKTLFIVLDSDEIAEYVMDQIEEVLDIKGNEPGKGIMFTVPLVMTHGIREQSVELSE